MEQLHANDPKSVDCTDCPHQRACCMLRVEMKHGDAYDDDEVEEDPEWWETRLRVTPTGRCIRQLPDGRCSKYSIRPRECREYNCKGDDKRLIELINENSQAQ